MIRLPSAVERFRGRDANLGPGMHVNTTVTLARDRARDVVTNSQRPKTFAPTFPECPECICSFAALADGKNQSPRRHRRVAMAKLARIFDFGGNIRQPLD